MDGTPRAMAAAARFARSHASCDTGACRPTSCLKMSGHNIPWCLAAGEWLIMADTLPLSAGILRLSRSLVARLHSVWAAWQGCQ